MRLIRILFKTLKMYCNFTIATKRIDIISKIHPYQTEPLLIV